MYSCLCPHSWRIVDATPLNPWPVISPLYPIPSRALQMVPLLIVGFFGPWPGKRYLLPPESVWSNCRISIVCRAKGTLCGNFFPFMCSLGILHHFALRSISDHYAQRSESVLTKVRAISFIASRVSGLPLYNS